MLQDQFFNFTGNHELSFSHPLPQGLFEDLSSSLLLFCRQEQFSPVAGGHQQCILNFHLEAQVGQKAHCLLSRNGNLLPGFDGKNGMTQCEAADPHRL